MFESMSNRWLMGTLALGVVLVAGALVWNLGLLSRQNPASGLGQVLINTGEGYYSYSEFETKKPITSQMVFDSGVLLETSEVGDLSIRIQGEFKARLPALSIVLIVKSEIGDEITLTLMKGDLTVEDGEQAPHIYIRKNGQKIAARLYNESPLKKTRTQESTETNSDLPGLSEQQIVDHMQTFKDAFFNCYAQVLTTSPQAKGDVQMNFTILPNGKPELHDINSQDFKQPAFKKCLSQVFDRIQFPEFNGSAISTVFPLRFE